MGANYQIRLFNTAEDIDQTVEVEGDRSGHVHNPINKCKRDRTMTMPTLKH